MSGSNGIGQLFKGVIIGIVLLLAIVGTMSILEKGKDNSNANTSSETTQENSIPAPAIDVVPPSTTINNDSAKQTIETISDNTNNTFIPTLENEKTTEELTPETTDSGIKQAEPQTTQYGMLELSVIDPKSKSNLKADFIIYDEADSLVSESKSTEGTTIRLPVGKYKVVTTLNSPTDTTRKTKAVQTTQFVTVTVDKTSTNTFELEPATTTGILQVSAINSKDGKPIKANFIVQKENGENIATRKNITASLFKLTAGSYKVTVKSGNNSDFRTIVVEPGESTQKIFKLTEAYKLGRVLVRIFDTKSNQQTAADIVIKASNGAIVQQLKAVSQTEISLPAANYKIIATGKNGKSIKNIRVIAGQSISEIFRFDKPKEEDSKSNNSNETQITDTVKISGVENADTDKTQIESSSNPSKATIELIAKNETDQRPLRSNFYIQTLNGKNIAKKIYATSAKFDLTPGRYKVTIRSKNRKNIVKNIEVFAGQKITQSYSLVKPNATIQQKTPTLAPPKPAPSSTKPKNIVANGFLSVAMKPARNTHFIVATKAGKKIVELNSVPKGNFKLDVGQYTVTAIHNNIRRRQTVHVRKGKTTRLVFNAASFYRPPPRNNNSANTKGILRSRIVNRSGQTLRGDLTITNNRGQVVARANAVTVGVFNLSPGPYTVILNYRGLRGNERVNIVARETTVQTFTIAPNNAPPQQTQQKSVKELLKERIEKGIQKQF